MAASRSLRSLATLAPALTSERTGAAVLLVEQRAEHVRRLDELVVRADGQGLGVGEGRLESAGEFVHSHRPPKWGPGAERFQ